MTNFRTYHPGEFANVPTALLTAKMSPAARSLWMALASYAGNKRECWPKIDEILRRMPVGTHPTSVSRAKAELVELGWLRVRRSRTAHSHNVYTLRYPDVDPLTLCETANSDSEIANSELSETANSHKKISMGSKSPTGTPTGPNHQEPADTTETMKQAAVSLRAVRDGLAS